MDWQAGGISEPTDPRSDIARLSEFAGLPEVEETDTRPSPLGAGYLILVARELTGLSQRRLAKLVGTSQLRSRASRRAPGSRICALLRVAKAAELDLVIGLRRRGQPKPDAEVLEAHGFGLVGTLHRNPEDYLTDFAVLREPHPWEGPAETGR